jgi:hypothetical protein
VIVTGSDLNQATCSHLTTPGLALRALALLCLMLTSVATLAQTKAEKGIYTCIDDRGRRLTADRPIPECSGKEQQILNQDGSIRAIVPPTLTTEERALWEARERAAQEARAAQLDAVRRDRNLINRYPTEAKHQAAREAALDTVRVAIKATEARLRELEAARKPLNDEAEFYLGKPLPARLRTAMDANEASVEAQRSAASTQEAELDRINKLYDAELERLRKLWAGAPAGSLGPLPGTNGKPPPAKPR